MTIQRTLTLTLLFSMATTAFALRTIQPTIFFWRLYGRTGNAVAPLWTVIQSGKTMNYCYCRYSPISTVTIQAQARIHAAHYWNCVIMLY